MKHLGVGYSDVLNMPTGERRYYLSTLIEQNRKEKESLENARKNAGNGKGQRTSTISGDQLKSKMNNGEIPLD